MKNALGVLRREGVRYLVVHESGYEREEYEATLSRLAAADGVGNIGPFYDGKGRATLYELR